jgi:hypothetical protein
LGRLAVAGQGVGLRPAFGLPFCGAFSNEKKKSLFNPLNFQVHPDYKTVCFTPLTFQNRSNYTLERFWTAVLLQ